MAKSTKKDLEQQLGRAHDLLALVGNLNKPAMASGQPMVGIRNVSDMTIGVPGFKDESDLALHADLGTGDPSSVAIISFAWWRELRRGKLVSKGLILRDDAVLGSSYLAAPEDRPEEMPEGHQNLIVRDPTLWVESRNEKQIREDLGKIDYEPTLQRIRRAVDLKLTELEKQYPNDPEAPLKAWNDLPSIYRLVEDITTRRIEKPEVIVSLPKRLTVTRDGVRED